ncbi:hypothetical protein MASR2M48_08280 [Spirochaetota bacterium]
MRPTDVVDGCAIACRMSSPARIVLAVDETIEQGTIDKLKEIIAASELDVAIQSFKRKFPQDMTRQIAVALDIKDSGSIFVLEPSTLIALHEAIVSNKPHIEQYVYVGGAAIKRPSILKARIGAPIGDLIEECGGFCGQPETIIMGGPYTGRAVADLDASVTRTTRAILALTSTETKSAQNEPASVVVIRQVCPEGLNPYAMIKFLRAGSLDDAFKAGLDRCSSCGACAYVCRSRIPLVKDFDEARKHEVDR